MEDVLCTDYYIFKTFFLFLPWASDITDVHLSYSGLIPKSAV